MADDLLYEERGAVGVVTFNRPAAHNALTFDMYDRLGEICAAIPAEGDLRALIITGSGGKAFAAGTDISLFRNFRTGSAANISRVAALTGVGRAMDMLMTTRLMGADEALAVGLVNELLDTPEALMERAHALAAQIATQAPLTMRAAKEVVLRMRERAAAVHDKDLVAMCYGSADFQEGLDAFLTKRPPQFAGR